tara:strand:- start:25813 stop:26355 length:543 start_codon:yes stop_codon:yes gene_type:complete
MCKALRRDIEIRGVVYPDLPSAAKACGVTDAAVRSAMRNGTLHRVGLGKTGREPLPVRINGRDYKSAAAAAKHLKCTKSAIYQALSCGREDKVARPQTYNGGASKPITIGTLSFCSHASASRALGFKSDFLSNALSRGSKRGWQRILSAAMTEVARRDRLVIKERQREAHSKPCDQEIRA